VISSGIFDLVFVSVGFSSRPQVGFVSSNANRNAVFTLWNLPTGLPALIQHG